MRKGLIIGLIVIVSGVAAIFGWAKYKENRFMEEMRVFQEEYEKELLVKNDEARDLAFANLEKLKRFYISMDVMFKKIDSLSPARMMKIDNGSDAYKKYIKDATRNSKFNFCFFPYEMIGLHAGGEWNETEKYHCNEAWDLCYYWNFFPATDSAGWESNKMGDFYFLVNLAAEELPDPDSARYLHILINYDNRDLKLFDEAMSQTDDMVQAVFDGAIIVYDLKAQMVVKFYPLEFTGSEQVRYNYTGNDPTTEDAQWAFREAYALDVQTNFEAAVKKMLSSEIGIIEDRMLINEEE